MKLASLEAIVRSLNEGNVRYLIAGGLAVNAHGYIRLTQDVDLVIALDPANIGRAFEVLATSATNRRFLSPPSSSPIPRCGSSGSGTKA